MRGTRISPATGEWQGRVSPAERIAFISDLRPDARATSMSGFDRCPWPGDAAAAATPASPTRVTRGGRQRELSLGADNARVAYAASRGTPRGVWVSVVSAAAEVAAARTGRGAAGGGGAGGGRGAAPGGAAVEDVRQRPLTRPCSRRGSTVCPRGRPIAATLLVATLPNDTAGLRNSLAQ